MTDPTVPTSLDIAAAFPRTRFKQWAATNVPLPYAIARRVYRSRTRRALVATTRYPLDRLRQARNGAHFAFDVGGPMGMGAVLNHIVKLLAYAEARGRIPAIAVTNPLYGASPGEDWFATYFAMNTPRDTAPARRARLSFLRVTDEYSVGAFAIPRHLAIAEVHRLFAAYITIDPRLIAIVDALTRDLPDGMFDLSIHYRGTDKLFEAEPVAYDTMLASLADLVAGRGMIRTVFLATDDPGFAERARDRFPAISFRTYYAGAPPPDARIPRHFSSIAGPDKAVEALVTMLALARAPLCLRTCSNLSAWSKILNPAMRTITLNRLHDGVPAFPERQIAALEALEQHAVSAPVE